MRISRPKSGIGCMTTSVVRWPTACACAAEGAKTFVRPLTAAYVITLAAMAATLPTMACERKLLCPIMRMLPFVKAAYL
jgi:hypothetical protein